MFVENVKLSESKGLDGNGGNGASTSGKGKVVTIGVLGSEGSSSMQAATMTTME